MRTKPSFVVLATLGVLLGCSSSQQGVAQDEPVRRTKRKEAEKNGATSKPTKSSKKKEDPRSYKATILDQYAQKKKEKPFEIEAAVLFVPEVSLFGGSGGKDSKLLELKRGSATIEVPLFRVEKLHILKATEDRLEVRLELRNTKPKGRNLTGTVKSSLLLRGAFADNGLKTTVKLREAVTITFEVMKKKKSEKK